MPVPTEPSHLPLDSGLMWFDLKIGTPDVSEPEGLKAFHGFSLANAGIRLANPGKDEVSRHFFNKCRFLDAMNRLFGSIVISALGDQQNFILHCGYETMFFVDATRQEA